MFKRWILVAAVVTGLLVSGCSSKVELPRTTKSPSAEASATSTKPSKTATETETDSASAPLDADACVEVTGANLDLAVASTSEEARTPADKLLSYDPPASVSEAIEHFVTTGGAQFDDEDFDKYNNKIENWVKQVCPS